MLLILEELAKLLIAEPWINFPSFTSAAPAVASQRPSQTSQAIHEAATRVAATADFDYLTNGLSHKSFVALRPAKAAPGGSLVFSLTLEVRVRHNFNQHCCLGAHSQASGALEMKPDSQRLCPHCGSPEISRSHRRGTVEKYLLRAVGVRPFRCANCDARFYRLKHSNGSESQDSRAA